MRKILEPAQGGKDQGPVESPDISDIIKVLQKTKDFEKELTLQFREIQNEDLTSRYEEIARQNGEAESSSEPKAPSVSEFEGLVSSVFMPHLGGYVDLERSNINELISKVDREEDWKIEEEKLKARLSGSDELFLHIKRSVGRCARLTTGKVLFDVSYEYIRGISNYRQLLLSRLPRKPDSQGEISVDEIRTTCLIINTAEYCNETLPSLEEKVRSTVDESYKEKIDFSDSQEELSVFITKVSLSFFCFLFFLFFLSFFVTRAKQAIFRTFGLSFSSFVYPFVFSLSSHILVTLASFLYTLLGYWGHCQLDLGKDHSCTARHVQVAVEYVGGCG